MRRRGTHTHTLPVSGIRGAITICFNTNYQDSLRNKYTRIDLYLLKKYTFYLKTFPHLKKKCPAGPDRCIDGYYETSKK